MGFLDAKFVRLAELLPVFAANYAKRFLEHVYDNAFDTPLGQKLAAMGKSKKYAVEFGLNLLTAFFEDRLAENTKLKKFVKEVGIDVAPEISKRMINGAKEEILAGAATDEEKELAGILLALEDKELIELLNWFYEKPAAEMMAVSGQLSLMSAEQIARLMRFSTEDREKFFGVLDPRSRPKKGRGALGMMADDINKLNERLEKSHRKETGQ